MNWSFSSASGHLVSLCVSSDSHNGWCYLTRLMGKICAIPMNYVFIGTILLLTTWVTFFFPPMPRTGAIDTVPLASDLSAHFLRRFNGFWADWVICGSCLRFTTSVTSCIIQTSSIARSDLTRREALDVVVRVRPACVCFCVSYFHRGRSGWLRFSPLTVVMATGDTTAGAG